jgi:hypothetical protein
VSSVRAFPVNLSWTSHASSFDEARLIRQNQIFAANGIGPSGEWRMGAQFRMDTERFLSRTAAGRQGGHSPIVLSLHCILPCILLDGRCHTRCLFFAFVAPHIIGLLFR